MVHHQSTRKVQAYSSVPDNFQSQGINKEFWEGKALVLSKSKVYHSIYLFNKLAFSGFWPKNPLLNLHHWYKSKWTQLITCIPKSLGMYKKHSRWFNGNTALLFIFPGVCKPGFSCLLWCNDSSFADQGISKRWLTMVNMGNNRHVPDIVLFVHDGPNLTKTLWKALVIMVLHDSSKLTFRLMNDCVTQLLITAFQCHTAGLRQAMVFTGCVSKCPVNSMWLTVIGAFWSVLWSFFNPYCSDYTLFSKGSTVILPDEDP